jgi:hypothetical protein
VALVRTDVSEEPGASFIRVTKIGELGTTQTATSNRRTLRGNTQVAFLHSVRRLLVAACVVPSSPGLTRATRRNNPEDTILHSHRRENLKSYRDKASFQFEARLYVTLLLSLQKHNISNN